jgi:nucleotide-binding universal stress UspA family protein
MNEQGAENPSSTSAGHSNAAAGPVLLCFDGSENAGRAISTAGVLLGSRTAIVLSVWEPAASLTSLNPIGDMVGRVTGIYREMDEIGAQLANRQADEGTAIARRAGFDAEALTAQGKPWVEILRVAEDHNVAAIVLGGGGRARLSSTLVGGVAARVLHHCPRPVLVVPAAGGVSSASEG